MCGIAGIYHLNNRPIPAHCLKDMCDVMKHRGPDDEGYVFFHVREDPYKNEGYLIEKEDDLPTIQNQEEWKQLFNCPAPRKLDHLIC